MKNILTSLLLVILTINSQAQKHEDGYSDIDKYKKTDVGSDFNDRFKKEGDKKDFKRLREFLREKEDLFDALKSELEDYSDKGKEVKAYEVKINQLTKLSEGKKPTELVQVRPELLVTFSNDYPLQGFNFINQSIKEKGSSNSINTKTVEEVTDIINKYTSVKLDIEEETKVHQYLEKNIKAVRQDIYDCRSQIDSALAPEYKQQEFRTDISICFTILIGLLLLIFFYIVYKKSDNNLSKELLSGNGLQFITLFVLIIAVILFGILSILQGSELAAILAGISGYILGKGISNNNSGNQNNVPHANAANSSETNPGTMNQGATNANSANQTPINQNTANSGDATNQDAPSNTP